MNNIRDSRTNRLVNFIVFQGKEAEWSYSQSYFAEHSEHITLTEAHAELRVDGFRAHVTVYGWAGDEVQS